MEFIERLEREVFRAGGEDYSLPAQRLVDFLRGEPSRGVPPGAGGTRRRLGRVSALLPATVGYHEWVYNTTDNGAGPDICGCAGLTLDDIGFFGMGSP